MAVTATLQTRLPVNLGAVSVFTTEHKELVNVLCSLTASPEEMLSHHALTAQGSHDKTCDWGAVLVATDDGCTLEIKFVNSYEQGKAATARFADEQLLILDGEGGIVIGMACHMDRSSFFNSINNQYKSIKSCYNVMFGEYMDMSSLREEPAINHCSFRTSSQATALDCSIALVRARGSTRLWKKHALTY
jgi:hypothetical protein